MLSSKQRKTTIDYLYDFSDSWEHSLVVTGGTLGDPEVSYPPVRNAPPEDCGGTAGFYNMLVGRPGPS